MDSRNDTLEFVAEIVAAYVGNNALSVTEIPNLISNVCRALDERGSPQVVGPTEKPTPAVPIRRSVQPDYIVCLEDGKKLKMLKRHLMTVYGLTPDQYRTKWGLPRDYPMVAPAYAAKRSEVAKASGLGRKKAAED